MDDKLATPVAPNKMATVAWRTAIFNIICWLLFAIPNFINSVWSTFELVAIPLSTILAIVAGIMGMRQTSIHDTWHWKSLSAIIVGILNIVLIVLSLIGIYAMVNFY